MTISRLFAGYFERSVVKAVAAAAAAALLVWTGASTVSRLKSESKNHSVEICLDYSEVCALCALNGYPQGDFLERCAAIGAASASLDEETPSSLAESGKIVFFPGSEYSRARLLDLASQGGMISSDLMVSQDQYLVKSVSDTLKARYNIVSKIQKAGKNYLFYPSIDPALVPGYWNADVPVGFSNDKQKYISGKGLRVVLKVRSNGNPGWLRYVSTENVSGLIWEGPDVPGYQGQERETASVLKERNFKYMNFEFAPVVGEEYIEKNAPELLVRGHTISEAELGHNPNPSFWISRWTRAVKERNIRFVYFHFWKNRPVEENISYLRSAAKSIKESGFVLETARPPVFPVNGGLPFKEFCALFISIAVPLIGLKLSLGGKHYIRSFFTVNIVSMAGGLLVASLLYDAMFMQKIVEIPLVRFIFFMPLLLSVLILLEPGRIKELWRTRIETRHLVISAVVLAAAVIVFVRSGNSAAEWLVPDQGFRQMLENSFLVRPRTKEFIFGQPLLLLGFYLRNPWIILAGMIGQVSILNTFMHAHTPLAISIVRTLHGLVLGFIVGTGVVQAYKIAEKLISNRPGQRDKAVQKDEQN